MRIWIGLTVVSLVLIVTGCIMIKQPDSGSFGIAVAGNPVTSTFLIRSFQSPGGMLLIWAGTLGLAGVGGHLASRRR